MRRVLIIVCCLLTLSVSGQGVKVGDLIKNKDGSEGIVFWLSPDATYGWMVATKAKELTAPFQGNFPGLSSVANRSGAMQDTAGYGNTAHLLEGSWTEFAPLAADFRNGWYIPSLGQLRKLLSLGCRLPIELGSEVYVSSTRGKDNFWVATRWGETKTQSDVVAYFPVRTFSLVEYDMTLSYRWNTGALTPEITERPVATTTYEVTATTPVGCYAKAKQTVFAASVTPETVDETICRGEVYRRYGIEASKSGEYRGTLTNAAGCEQEVIVRLKVNEPVEKFLEASIRAGEVYRENGFTEWEAGEHRQVWQRPNGCDSTVILQLTVHSLGDTLIRDTVCEGTDYKKHGFNLTDVTAGLQVEPLHLTDRWGEDSTVRLELWVNPVSRTPLSESICSGESYAFFGETLTESGTYYRTLTNRWGCDSTLELNLTVHPVLDTLFRDTVCAGTAYKEHGFDLLPAFAGQQVELLHQPNRWGCDSTVRLELWVNPVSWAPLPPVSVCAGESYVFFGKTLTESGTYYHKLKNHWGCDSILELNLTVHPVLDTLFRDTVCAGSAYKKHDFDLIPVSAGRQTELMHLPARWGCDSTVRLELWVNPVSRMPLPPEHICSGESYAFFGETLTESGTYYRTLTNRWGCDSTLELNLTVHPVLDTLFRDTVCAGTAYKEHGFDLLPAFAGRQAELLRLTDRWGCDSTVRLELWVNPVSRTMLAPEFICSGESYDFFGDPKTQTGTYHHTLTNQWGCDSILELNLTVRTPARDTIRAAICAGERYQAYGFDEAETGFYERKYAGVHGCDSIVYLDLTVNEDFRGSLQVELADCALHEYAFTADWSERTPIEGSRYEWNFGDGGSRETETPSVRYAYADTGTYAVRLKVVTPGDCFRKREETVHIPYYSPELAVYSDPAHLETDRPEIRLWTDSVAGMRYTWDFGDGSTGYGWSVEHTYVFQKQETYRVVLESLNEEDCPARKEFTLHAYATVDPPNTITPNGDGVNDYFMRGYRVRIFNRNGVVIFQGDDGWDGLRDGQPVPEDTYFYEVYYLAPEGEKSKTGYVTVVR